jgi:thiol-disulfide isomerase/thioredoxin
MHHITRIESRTAFINLLSNNPGMIVLKFGANWCSPCKKIEPQIRQFFASLPQDGSVIYGEIDVDESTDVYAYLKSSRRVNGIPVILCYVRGYHEGIIPTLSVTGANIPELNNFFLKCRGFLR